MIDEAALKRAEVVRLPKLPAEHAALIQQFLEVKFTCRPGTRLLYLKVLFPFAEAFRFKSLLEISKEDVRRYFIHWKEQAPQVKEGTLALTKIMLGAFYQWLINEDRYPHKQPPTDGIAFSLAFSGEAKPVELDELQELDRVIELPLFSAMERALYHVLRSSGVRISEAVRIRRTQDLLLPQRLIVIPKEHAKNHRFTRRIPISDKTVEAIQALLLQDTSPSDWLFHRRDGHHINDHRARLMLARVISIAYPSGWTKGHGAHQFRHTFATNWIERDGSAVVLQQIMGWTSLKMVDRYFHMSNELLQRAANKFFDRNEGPQTPYRPSRIETQLNRKVHQLQSQLLVQHIKQHAAQAKSGAAHV